MVRLKEFGAIRQTDCGTSFNSTMVRLKDHCFKVWLYTSWFQFHYGTIKRRGTCNAISHKVFQFHYGTIKSVESTLVVCSIRWFQFHYGTIKSSTHIPRVYPFLCFNSTMVRLKAFVLFFWAPWLSFQFHYGTIKS